MPQLQVQQRTQDHLRQQARQAPHVTMLLERRIIELLTSTNLTFKEIITKLDGENLSASIGIIRRINRDNRYRRPRYDSKLTPSQRESLVEELRDHNGLKPNLSLLAKRYGVCHGSVWYWWDKLNRVGRNGHAAGREGKLERRGVLMAAYGARRQPKRRASHSASEFDLGRLHTSPNACSSISLNKSGEDDSNDQVAGTGHEEADGEDDDSSRHLLGLAFGQHKRRHFGLARRRRIDNLGANFLLDKRQYSYVGRVSIVTRAQGEHIDLPILMFSRRDLLELNRLARDSPAASLASGETSLEPSSPSPMVVVDEDDEEHGFGSLIGSSLASGEGGIMSEMQLDLSVGGGAGARERATADAGSMSA